MPGLRAGRGPDRNSAHIHPDQEFMDAVGRDRAQRTFDDQLTPAIRGERQHQPRPTGLLGLVRTERLGLAPAFVAKQKTVSTAGRRRASACASPSPLDRERGRLIEGGASVLGCRCSRPCARSPIELHREDARQSVGSWLSVRRSPSWRVSPNLPRLLRLWRPTPTTFPSELVCPRRREPGAKPVDHVPRDHPPTVRVNAGTT
jgi:hypothetical protein